MSESRPLPQPKPVTVEARAARKVAAGHPWLYANEVVKRADDLADVDLVLVHDPAGRPIATGTYFKHSLIQVRVLTRRDERVDADLFRRRLQIAADRRRAIYLDLDCLRLVHGECDGLPGLVVDRYADVLVLELNTQGIFLFLEEILDALEALFAPRAIVLRNTSTALTYEQLEPRTEILRGTSTGPVVVSEWGVKYLVDPLVGQKTGLFLDQKENRRALRRWCRDATVWDVFAYSGGWGLHALAAGARHVTFVDSSAAACAQIRANLELNGFASAEVVQASAFDALREMPRNSVDVLVLDPPAFAKTKKDLPAAAKAYVDLNRVGLQRLDEGGLLATSTCSFHVSAAMFAEIVDRAVFQSSQRVELLAEGGQAPDHPVHLEFPESRYLKTKFLRKLPYHP
ncbi:MAG TPA: class I SAM-dependent rRNA methyltransferase [Candidatus Krumholzibacteria bacterium]|nr:class I SAM-dependent rRNA methyltransferase [Candidatus Krumholzibacteria bacterium]HPD72460.1 class I SAM-dependent rRNA methyltransferase [Candidatus Krumholzibacteria bacterium]HRY40608.1 class I SAM-dependent rRNA methyltransferase [Candidatus Krumholzibacteria bacterium]